MKLFHILLFSLLVVSARAEDYLILCCGQSNMGGVAKISELPDDLKPMPENIIYLKPSDSTAPPEPVKSFADIPKFGTMPSFLHALSKARPKDRFVVLNDAVGGSALASWVPDYGPSELTRRPGMDGSTVQLDIGKNYKAMTRRLNAVRKMYPNAKPLAFLWIQGEADKGKWAEVYLENFKRLVANVRRDIGAPQLYVIIGEPGKAEEAVRQALKDYLKLDPESAFAPGLDLSHGTLHYNAKGYIELGRRLEKQLETYLAKRSGY